MQKDKRSTESRATEQRPLREVKGQPRSQVVFFSNLPREDDKKKELLTVARRFGTVEKHLFLTDQVGGASELLLKVLATEVDSRLSSLAPSRPLFSWALLQTQRCWSSTTALTD